MRVNIRKRILAFVLAGAMAFTPCMTGMGTVRAEDEITDTTDPSQDYEAPRITNVEVVNEEVETMGEARIRIYAEDNLSGITRIHAEFAAQDDSVEHFEWTSEEGFQGSVCMEIGGQEEREFQQVYTLRRIEIDDAAGNVRVYNLSEDGSLMNDTDRENPAESFATVSYTVSRETEISALKVIGMEPREDQDLSNVSAGDTLHFTIHLFNGSNHRLNFQGEDKWGNFSWKKKGTDYQINKNVSYGSTSLEPGEIGEIEASVTLSNYMGDGEFEFTGMALSTPEYNLNCWTTMVNGKWKLDGSYYDYSTGMSGSIGRIDWNNPLDFTVTSGVVEDTEAPLIRGVRLVKTELETIDSIEAIVDYEEDTSGIEQIHMRFATGDEWGEWVSLQTDETSDGQYTGRGSLTITGMRGNRPLNSEYTLREINVSDYAGNERHYYLAEDGETIMTGYENAAEAFRTVSCTVTKETKLQAIKVLDMKPAEGEDFAHIAAGDQIAVSLKVYNSADKPIRLDGYGTLTWVNPETNYQMERTFEGERVVLQPEQSAWVTVRTDVSKYMEAGNMEFTIIHIGTANGSLRYERWTDGENVIWNGNYWDEEMQINYPIGDFSYDGAVDLVITEGAEPDVTAPIIKEIRLDKTEIETAEEIRAEVDYEEDISGIASMSLCFENEDGVGEWLELWQGQVPEGEYKGTGTIELKNKSFRKLGSTYRLRSVAVRDYAGNERYYWNVDGVVGSWEEGIDPLPELRYTVTSETAVKAVEVTGVRFEGADPQKMAAGDSFEAVLQMENKMDKAVTISGVQLNWRGEDSYGFKGNDSWLETEIVAGETAEIRIPITVSRFAAKEKYILDYMNIAMYMEGGSSGSLMYSQWDGNFYMSGESIPLQPIPNQSDLDYTVIKADTPDMEAPYITDWKCITEKITTPGTALFELHADEGHAKLERIHVTVRREEAEYGETFYGELEKGTLLYSPVKKCYLMKMSLPERYVEGEYLIQHVTLVDEEGKSRDYQRDEETGDLYDYDSGNSVAIPAIVVAESELQDFDFEKPVLQQIRADKTKIQTPDMIQYTLKGHDESGFDSIELYYEAENGDYFFLNEKLGTAGTDSYTCRSVIRKYFKEGNYQLMGVSIRDASIHGNWVYYSRREEGLVNTDNSEDVIPYRGELDLQITNGDSKETILTAPVRPYGGSIDEEKVREFEEAIAALPRGSEVVLLEESANNGIPFIPTGALQTIKDAGLKVTLVNSSDVEVKLDGKNLTDAMIAQTEAVRGLSIGVYPGESRNCQEVDFVNGYDRAGYSMEIQSFASTDIPFTLRFPVSDDFYAKYQENNIRFSYKDEETWERGANVLEENLTMTEDRYVEVEYTYGIDLETWHAYYISTDTVKYYDYGLDVTAVSAVSGTTVQKGSGFDVTLDVSNHNETALENVLVYPLVKNALADDEYDTMAGCYQFAGGNAKVEMTEDGDALIKKLAPGETVKLKLTVTVPETADYEFAEYLFVAEISKSDEELFAYGSDGFVLTLQEKQTALKGDINVDGIVDVSDLMYMLQVVSERIKASELTDTQLFVGDVANNDKAITVDDLMKLLQYVSERIITLE